MCELISSCYEAQERFRSAAATSQDGTLKRLFEIYAEQRTRFAEELREHLRASEPETAIHPGISETRIAPGQDSLRTCLDTESRTLQLYRKALAARGLPTRTHFLVSSQLALLERAHERVNTVLQSRAAALAHRVTDGARIRA